MLWSNSLDLNQAYVEIARRYGMSPVALAIGKDSPRILHFYLIINTSFYTWIEEHKTGEYKDENIDEFYKWYCQLYFYSPFEADLLAGGLQVLC